MFLYCRAIQASLALTSFNNHTPTDMDDDDDDDTTPLTPENTLDNDLQMALLLSKRETEQEEQERIREEQMLEEILKLSLTEK